MSIFATSLRLPVELSATSATPAKNFFLKDAKFLSPRRKTFTVQMPGRQSHGSAPSKKPKKRPNNKQRSLNAFSIAAQEIPEKLKIRQNRLGESQGGNRLKKRPREHLDSTGDEDVPKSKISKKDAARVLTDELHLDAGSDSEGNEWRMGEIDSDDDSDIDSDEAFGESDEERFDSFAFSGGSKKSTSQGKYTGPGKAMTLDEPDKNIEISSASEEDDLGDDAIDLAAMLDATEGDSVGEARISSKGNEDEDQSSDEGSVGSSEKSSDDSLLSSTEDDDENDPDKMVALQDLIAKLPETVLSSQSSLREQNGSASELRTPADLGATSKAKLTLEDLNLPSIKDPFVKRSLKLLASDSKSAMKGSTSRRLEVPLAKRQQDRLDRNAAYDGTKETLGRWTDTIKHNRRAEHLIFPLPDLDASSLKANNILQPTGPSKPFNELEATIQTILKESGLSTSNGRDNEDKLIQLEELETNTLSVEEIRARRDQLRKARDLLFREEIRAKRIKKIKSKSYRKVHRKEREKEERMNREALIEAGVPISEDEQEIRDRRRAEERMGARYRGSKWAKATKDSGRAAWDLDARAGITDLARRDEELRKRVEGKVSRKCGTDASESSSSESDDEGSDDQDALKGRVLRKLEVISDTNSFSKGGPGSRLLNMKFMLKAEASKAKENAESIEKLRKEIAGEVSSEGEEDDAVGRRAFGPRGEPTKNELPNVQFGSEFEETVVSDGEDVQITTQNQNLHASNTSTRTKTSQLNKKSDLRKSGAAKPNFSIGAGESTEGGAWSRSAIQNDVIGSSETRRQKQKNSAIQIEELDISKATVIARPVQIQKKAETRAKQTNNSSDEDESEEDPFPPPFAIKDQELIKRAFAGADVVGEFEAEKRQIIADEDDQVVDNTLPGWGNWVGEGLSKKEKLRNKGRFLTKVEGIKEQNRKDSKLERVIINEKRAKKV